MIQNEKEKTLTNSPRFQFTITKKLLGGFIAVLILMVTMLGISVYQLMKLNSDYEKLIDDRVTKLIHVKNLKTELSNLSTATRGYLLTGEQLYIDDYDQNLKLFDKNLKTLFTTTVDEEPKAYLRSIKANKEQYHEYTKKIRAYKMAGNTEGYLHLMKNDMREVATKFNKSTDKLVQYQQEKLEKGIEDATKEVNNATRSLIIIGVLSVIVGLAISIFISRLIARPVINISDAMNHVASGDLSIEPIKAKNRDEIGTLVQSFNKMTEDLRNVIRNISDSSSQVASSSEQLSASSEQSTSAAEQVARISQETAAGATQALSQFQEVTASIQELASGMEQIANSSTEMLESTETAANLTQKGTESVQSIVNQMNEIVRSVDQTTLLINSLGERSKEITGIVSLITNIADQTNLLALNAAIEAARAGEHGKGFAVVADEVRKLAEESKHSADKITEMITFIQKETEQAVTSMQAGNKQIEEGLSHTSYAQTAFSEITSSINEVTSKVQEVSASVEETNALSEQIALAISKVEEIAQQSYHNSQESSGASEEQLATMEEVSSSAQSLSVLAEDLQKIVAKFNV